MSLLRSCNLILLVATDIRLLRIPELDIDDSDDDLRIFRFIAESRIKIVTASKASNVS